jgi:hypothetical protein
LACNGAVNLKFSEQLHFLKWCNRSGGGSRCSQAIDLEVRFDSTQDPGLSILRMVLGPETLPLPLSSFFGFEGSQLCPIYRLGIGCCFWFNFVPCGVVFGRLF